MSEPYIGEIRMIGFGFAPRNWAFCDGQILPIRQNQALYAVIGTMYGGDGRDTFALPDLRGRVPIHSGQGPGLELRQLGEALGSETVTLDIAEIPIHKHTVVTSAPPASVAVTDDFVTVSASSSTTTVGNDFIKVDAPTAGVSASNDFVDVQIAAYTSGGNDSTPSPDRILADANKVDLYTSNNGNTTLGGVSATVDPSKLTVTNSAPNVTIKPDALNVTVNAPSVSVDPAFIGVSVGKPGAAALDTGGSQWHNNMQPSLSVNFIIALDGIFPPRS